MGSDNFTVQIQGKLNCLKAVEENYSTILDQIPSGVRTTLLWILVVVILFIVVVICGDYYLPAMETYTFRFELTNYTAGRSVMALISTLPFILDSGHNIASNLQIVSMEYMIGVGTFKIVLALGISGLFLREKLHVDWWPMTSEFLWYSTALFSLPTIFFNYHMLWYNTILLLVFFVGRMLLTIFDDRVSKRLKTPDSRCMPCVIVKGELEPPLTDPTENEVKVLKFPECKLSNVLLILFAILTFPTRLLLFYIVPHPYSKKFAKLFWVTILICTCFFIVLSYFLTWALVEILSSWGMPDILIYHLIIPFGLSYVSAVSTIMAINKGHAEMGISNAYGSATNDILLGFGLLTFLQSLLYENKVMEHTTGFFNIVANLITLAFVPLCLCWIKYFSIGRLFGILLLAVFFCHTVARTVFYTENVQLKKC